MKATICKALCESGKFETGQGTCAAICMEILGDARKRGCQHRERVHGGLATRIEAELKAAHPLPTNSLNVHGD